MTGPCWWCSNQMATRTHYSWYDGRGYYRYNDTCTCNFVMGCGSTGYQQNGYCSHCGTYYPTLTISSKTNRWGVTTYTESCWYCGYSYTNTFG